MCIDLANSVPAGDKAELCAYNSILEFTKIKADPNKASAESYCSLTKGVQFYFDAQNWHIDVLRGFNNDQQFNDICLTYYGNPDNNPFTLEPEPLCVLYKNLF